MGITAELVAGQYGITRQDQDAFAAASHAEAAAAVARGKFRDEIIPVEVENCVLVDGKMARSTELVDADDGRRGTRSPALAGLKPVFKADRHGYRRQLSQMTDGAAARTGGLRGVSQEERQKPLARFVAFAVKGVPPELMGIGPVAAIPAALKLAGLTLDDIGLSNSTRRSRRSRCPASASWASGRARQRQRRRDRARPSAGRDGRPPDRDRAARARAPQGPLRRHLDVRRRRHGRGRLIDRAA